MNISRVEKIELLNWVTCLLLSALTRFIIASFAIIRTIGGAVKENYDIASPISCRLSRLLLLDFFIRDHFPQRSPYHHEYVGVSIKAFQSIQIFSRGWFSISLQSGTPRDEGADNRQNFSDDLDFSDNLFFFSLSRRNEAPFEEKFFKEFGWSKQEIVLNNLQTEIKDGSLVYFLPFYYRDIRNDNARRFIRPVFLVNALKVMLFDQRRNKRNRCV